MTETEREKWEAIRTFEIGAADGVISFEDKLVERTGWTRRYAQRAIEEYRRFLLLAAVAGHAVSPSPVVDEVWHLHLLYTRSYWDELCPKVLGMRLHHEPAAGAAGEADLLTAQYELTRGSYTRIFGEDAPADLWPLRPVHSAMVQIDPRLMVALPRRAWVAFCVILALLLAAWFAAIIMAIK